MSNPVSLLLVEDDELDAELMLDALSHYGYEITHDRVDSEEGLRGALARDRSWDLVLCDHGLPRFSSAEALGIVREFLPEVPFVVLSGTIGEEAAVEALKAGARDVVLKANLSRLGPVVDRELREAAIRRRHEQAALDHAKLEAQLIQSQKLDAIGRLAAGIAHDYRNLLGVVVGFSGLALRHVDESHKAHGYITEIRSAGERAISLTDQLLTFSSTNEGTPQLVNINAMLGELAPMLRHLLGGDVQLAVELAPEVPPILIDQGRLEQVIVNLTANARDAMPDGGTFTLETDVRGSDAVTGPEQPDAQAPQQVVVTARDTGIGMDELTRAQIFEPFFTTKNAEHGTGLGLATSYGIIEQAGGFMTVESAPGQGAAFSVRLPAADSYDQPGEIGSQSARRAAATETVLLVEDNDILRRLLKEGLVSSGYVVLSARDGVVALEHSERHDGEIDVLVADSMVAGTPGAELLSRILEQRPQAKLLVMSAQPASPERSSGATANGFIAKPFTLAALAARLRELLDS
jgi:two-component system cell cycle sensor histidine kinase/response regulator CckA